MKLKTLKDFEADKNTTKYPWHLAQDLKEEAIKWMKSEIEDEVHGKVLTDGKYMYGNIAWIKHFFNITEEDLK